MHIVLIMDKDLLIYAYIWENIEYIMLTFNDVLHPKYNAITGYFMSSFNQKDAYARSFCILLSMYMNI